MKKLFSAAGALTGALLILAASFANPANANTVNCTGSPINATTVHFYLSTQTCIVNNVSSPADGQLNFAFADVFDPDVFAAFMNSALIQPGDIVTSLSVNGVFGSVYNITGKRVDQDFTGSIVASILAVLSGQQYLMTVHLNKNADTDDLTFLDASVSAVPIPAALPLLAAGLSAMGFMGWRRKRRAA
jgi:hypothetical protein